MFSNIKSKIKFTLNVNSYLQIIYPTILVLITLFLSYVNYTPNTFLTGWDTLHPEFNFSEYFNRILNGAWQTHQGLGAVNTQAHASEIPRIVILYLISLLFKLSDIRYIYAFLMLIIGPLGVYYFTKHVLLQKINTTSKELGSFLAGLFYLLNLGTLQHFYVPLEMFLTHYAFLGWSFLFATKAYQEPNKKNYLSLIFVSILMTSQAHTPTLFYTYFLAKILYFFGLSIDFKLKKLIQNIQRSFFVLLTILLINSFWVLPGLYFLITKSAEIKESKIHHLFSNEAFLANASYGYIKDISIIRGFLFGWGEYIGNNQFGPLLNEWIYHFDKYNLYLLGYLFFAILFVGALISALNKNKAALGLFFVTFISMVFLLSINPPFGFIIRFLLDKLPLIKEILRFPFTKFSVFLMFTYAGFFGAFFGYLTNHIKNKKILFISHFLIVSIVLSSLIFYMLPAFKGNLISNSMKVSIPQRYFDLFDYLDSQEEYGRVVHLPIHSFWGWVYYDWDTETRLGYQGAGFLWFGIKQPLLDREFDRWNIKNEQFYRELSYAIYTNDKILIENILEKYKVRWLLLDKSVIAPGYPDSVLNISQIVSLLGSMNNITLVNDFGSDLLLYKYNPNVPFKLLEKNSKYKDIGQPFFRDNIDPFYSKNFNYVNNSSNFNYFIGTSGVNENLEINTIYSNEKNLFIDDYNNNLLNIKILSKEFLEDYNNNNYFKVGNLLINYEDINNYTFDTDLYNNLSVYKKDISTKVNLDFNIEYCSNYFNEGYYSLEKLNNSYILDAKSTRTCLTADLTNIKDQFSDELTTNLVYFDLPSINSSELCVLDKTKNKCVNYYIDNIHIITLEKDISNYLLSLTIDATTSNLPKTISLSDLSFGTLNSVYQGNLEDITYYYENNDLSLSKDLNNSNFISNLPHYPSLCESVHKSLKDSTIEYGNRNIIYNSPTYSLCDNFNFYTVNHKNGYLLEIEAKNIAGESLRFCLTKIDEQKCLSYFSLPKSNKLEKYYYLIPPFGSDLGYTLRLSNIVFGNFITKNELNYISFIPVNYNNLLENNSNNYNEQILDNLLIYNQSYDSGWVAFCGFKPCNAEHVVVNNWSNGWIFNDISDMSKNIKIVFWPQYLQYLGYILALIPIIFVLFYKNKK